MIRVQKKSWNSIKNPYTMHEHDECKAFAKLLRMKGILFWKIASEIWTSSFNQISRQKAEWMTKGLPDYIIVVPKKNWKQELVFVEMKRKANGVVSTEQKRRLFNLNQCWVKATVCKWVIEAWNFISKIMNDD